MKANELMIGDWVMQDDNLQQNRVCQITGIYNKVVVDVTGEKMPLHESHVKPIPLTEEILKANGYEEVVGEKGMYGVTIAPYFKRDDSPEVFCDGNPFAVWFNDPVDIKYVHQLQHVLRLCGADKEIIINKEN